MPIPNATPAYDPDDKPALLDTRQGWRRRKRVVNPGAAAAAHLRLPKRSGGRENLYHYNQTHSVV